uniref:Aminopeptidase n=1 Tax=Lutzomyia longipalpis TaxID=7200 RepID=A0A7G3AUC8_LUTLO
MLKLGLIAYLLVGIYSTTISASPIFDITSNDMAAEDGEVSYRLPNNTLPVYYDLRFTTRIHAADFTYTGSAAIQINVVEATNTITMHSRDIEIQSIVVRVQGTTENLFQSYAYDPDTEFLTITTTRALTVGPHDVLIDFQGVHSRAVTYGWYAAAYTNNQGNTVWLATTDFEAPDARQAFPCYDSPEFKAVFKITITYDQSYDAISNMPVENTITNTDGTFTTSFVETPPMSTYLVAFAVSDFDKRCGRDRINRDHCAYARPNGIDLVPWSLDTAIKGVEALDDIYGVVYPLPKLDQIAIPDVYFGSGAMENWGLVTYRESRLLLNESWYNYREKDSIGTVILHEFAHQWFGDLVSPMWWTYLWLNEGFATLYEYYGTNRVYPDMRLMDLMVYETVQGIMLRDGVVGARPMTHYVETRANIRGLFDYVSYQKAGTVLRMMMYALGEPTWHKGLKHYLEAKAYGNAVAEDLFAGIQTSVTEDNALPAGLNVLDIMNSWTLVGGFPILTVTFSGTNGFTLTQKACINNNPNMPPSSWYIPITYSTKNNPNFDQTRAQAWFRGDASSLQIPVDGWNNAEDWLILNNQQTSYYRVNYPVENWLKIADELNNGSFSTIHLLNRAQLLDDSLDLASFGMLDLDIPLRISYYLRNETDYIPFASWSAGFGTFFDRLIMSDHSEKITDYVQQIVETFYAEYGAVAAPGDVYFTILARTLAINWACRVGIAECLEATAKEMSDHINNGKILPLDYNTVLPCAGLRDATDEDYFAYLDRLTTTTTSRSTLINNLICTDQHVQLERLLQVALTSPALMQITSTEASNIILGVARKNLHGYEMVLDFINDNIFFINYRFTYLQLQNIFRELSRQTYSETNVERLQTLFKSFESQLGETFEQEFGQIISGNIEWMHNVANPAMDQMRYYVASGSYIFISMTAIFFAVISFLILQ